RTCTVPLIIAAVAYTGRDSMTVMTSTMGSMPRPMKKLRSFIVLSCVCRASAGELCLEFLVLPVEPGVQYVRNAVPEGKVRPGAHLHIEYSRNLPGAVAGPLLALVNPPGSAVAVPHDDDGEQVPRAVLLYRITVRHMSFIHFRTPHMVHGLGDLYPTAASPRTQPGSLLDHAGCV